MNRFLFFLIGVFLCSFSMGQESLIDKVNKALMDEDYSTVVSLIDEVIANDTSNQNLYYIKGLSLANIDSTELAIISYQKALSIDSMFFEPLYNLAALYFNDGVKNENLSAVNTVPDEYLRLKSKAEKSFRHSLGYFERAHNIELKNQSVISSLLELYRILNEHEKYVKLKSQVEN